jgi:hypothetical protein
VAMLRGDRSANLTNEMIVFCEGTLALEDRRAEDGTGP